MIRMDELQSLGLVGERLSMTEWCGWSESGFLHVANCKTWEVSKDEERILMRNVQSSCSWLTALETKKLGLHHGRIDNMCRVAR